MALIWESAVRSCLHTELAVQDGAPESQPRPDSTAINQKAPLSADEHGKPQVGKVGVACQCTCQ